MYRDMARSMSVKTILKCLAERATNAHILRTIPRGFSASEDIRRFLPNFEADVIFDVGAHVGESAQLLRQWYRHSTIFCFEPVAESSARLSSNVKLLGNIRCFQVAFSDRNGAGQMNLSASSSMSHLSHSSQFGNFDGRGETTQPVAVETLDHFTDANGISRVDYLKIDTEGNDLAVLKGAANLLRCQRIGLVEVEAGMNRQNTWHICLHDLQEYLEDRGYLLFGVYEQTAEWPTNQPNLRRANCVFLSPQQIQANTIPVAH
jgi:FkbM family methyltransferase